MSFTAKACAGLRTNASRHHSWRPAFTRPGRALRRGGRHRFGRCRCIALALRERRILLTEDKDFGDLVFRRERRVPGFVLMRVASEHTALKTARLAAAVERYGE